MSSVSASTASDEQPRNVRPLTPERREKLHRAVDNAQGYGACNYLTDDERSPTPSCVIAQLADMEGVTVDELREWEGRNIMSVSGIPLKGYPTLEALPGTEKLSEYDPELLRTIQRVWDDLDHETADEARVAMHALIDEAP